MKAGDEREDVFDGHVGADSSSALSAFEEIREGLPKRRSGGFRGALEMDARAPERIDEVTLGQALFDETLEEPEERAAGIGTTREGSSLLGDALDAMDDDRREKRLLRREVPIERADAEACTTGDLVDRNVDPLRRKDGLSNVEDALPISLRIGAQTTFLAHDHQRLAQNHAGRRLR